MNNWLRIGVPIVIAILLIVSAVSITLAVTAAIHRYKIIVRLMPRQRRQMRHTGRLSAVVTSRTVLIARVVAWIPMIMASRVHARVMAHAREGT